mgnify:CR=1 FL=1
MKLRNKKTGEIIDLEVGRITDIGYGSAILLSPVAAINESYTYPSLAELNEEWEDYEPKEPLIKDEKIRKAVRAWAEANGFAKLGFVKWADNHWLLRAENEDGHEFDIDFFDNGCKKLPKYEYETFYTIAELCGDEEAPEPLEPKFIDLDERIKEKEEE